MSSDHDSSRDLVAVANLVRDGRAATRGEIASLLSVRSSTVSDRVGRLLEAGLLYEAKPRPRGRGRPASSLSYNHRRLGAILVTVTGRELVAMTVDLDFRIIAEMRVTPASDTGTADMGDHLATLVRALRLDLPIGTDLCAVVISVSGLLDVPTSRWCMSSRWPNLRDLGIGRALGPLPCPLHIMRNLDAELSGVRMRDPDIAKRASLLLHWGEGIGAAYSDGISVVNQSIGRFCEVGHWELGDRRGRACPCGNTDCLETVAALWSLEPHFRRAYPELGRSETSIGETFWQLELEECSEMVAALGEVLRVTTNLCRLLFPERIILTGPFVQNPAVQSGFMKALKRAPLLSSLDQIKVSINEIRTNDELAGALAAPLGAGVASLLETGRRST